MLPTGVAALVRLKTLLTFTENASVYGLCTGGGLGGVWDAAASVVRGAPGGGAFGSMADPNLNALPRFRLTEMKPGPRPMFRGMIFCPGEGVGSRAPKGVMTTPGLFRSVANAGRSLKNVSPFVSRPVVILNGLPEVAMPKRLIVKLCGAV